MPRQTAYFDSQASAAAALKLDVYDLRDAKAAGCPAFRSGRVYRDELIKWFENRAHESTARRAAKSDDEIVSADAWKDRRSVLFEVLEFLHDAYQDKRIDLATYAKIGTPTVEFIIKIGKAWDAGIDASGFRQTWRACLGRTPRH
jgi:hypothetical protein